jgi:dimethylaniline monooxygenase (N-oxide forming)
MRLPGTVEEAKVQAEWESAWMRKHFPDMISRVNASYSGSLDFWK